MLGMGTLGLGPDIATTSTAVAPKPSVWDNINNVITKVVQPAANVYTQIKTNQTQAQATVPGYTPSTAYPTQPQAVPPAPAADNTKKYLLIGGGVLLAGGVLYAVTRKKKK